MSTTRMTKERLIELRRYRPTQRQLNTSSYLPAEVERTGRDIFEALSELIIWREVDEESNKVRGVEPGDLFGDPVEIKSRKDAQ